MCSLARSRAGGRGGAGHRAVLQALRDRAGRRPRAGAAHGGAAADADAVVVRLLPFGRAGAQDRRAAGRRETFDLIFVHCSSVAPYVAARAAHAEDPRLRRHGFAEVARVRALQAVSADRWATGSKAAKLRRRGAAARAPLRPVHRDHARRVGDARRLSQRNADRLVPERRGQRVLRAGRRRPTTPTRSASSGRMDYYPNQECMFDFCAQTWPLLRAQRPATKLLIVGADPSPAIRKLGELPGVTVTGSVPDVRPYVRALGADGGAAQHRARHAEQDPRSDGDGRAGGHQRHRRRRRRRRRRRAPAGRRHRAEMRARRSCASWQTAASARASPRPAGRGCCRTTPGRARCSGWTASSSAAAPDSRQRRRSQRQTARLHSTTDATDIA